MPQAKHNYNGIKYDSTLEEPLSALISAAKEDGVTIKVTGGYVSKNEQDKLFKAEVERLMQEKDYSQVKAETYPPVTLIVTPSSFAALISAESGSSRVESYFIPL